MSHDSVVFDAVSQFAAKVSPHFIKVMDPAAEFLSSLDWIGESTYFVKLDALDEALVPAADALGMQMTLIKFTASIFLVYPLAYILWMLPGRNIKHFFSFAIGFVIMQWIYGPNWIHSFITSLGTYLIAMLAPAKIQHKIAFWFVMTYMVVCHWYRMYVSYMSGIFDFTGTQMVLTMKLTSFAYNYYDGTADFKNVFGVCEDKKKAKVYADRKKYAITKLPNPLEFFGYIYCFTCIGAGPAFEYADYVRAIDGTAFKRITPPGKDGEAKKESVSRPSPVLPALSCFVIGVVMLVGHLQMAARFPMSGLYKNPQEVYAMSHWSRYIYGCIALAGDRMKYYFVWKMAEGASLLAGFGFQGYDDTGKVIGWKGVENIDIIAFETGANIATMSRAWNKRTQGWLERYTYQRSGRNLVLTYFISAIWHGLYPGFFFFFMSIPLLTNCERLIKQKINPLVVPGYDGYNDLTYPNTLVAKIYWGVCVLFTLMVMMYFVQPFSFQGLDHVCIVLGSYYYMPHIFVFVLYLFLTILPTPKKQDAGSKGKKE